LCSFQHSIATARSQFKLDPHHAASALGEQRQWASERNLAGAYQDMTNTLTERAKNGSSTCRMMSGILPGWFVAYPFDPPFQIWTTRKGKWSEELGRVIEYQAPTLSPDHRYPLERRCDAIVGAELAEGRSIAVGQKAAVTFSNLTGIGKALRAARKARREDMEQQAEAFQPPMFDL
jgi:hypothetical protein